MRADPAGVLVVVLGGVVLRVTLSGEFENYVRVGLAPWLLVVGVGLIVLGCAQIVLRLRAPDHDRPARAPRTARLHTHGPLAVAPDELATARRADRLEGHDHSRAPAVGWLLVLPVFLVLLVPPPALGAFAAARGDGTVPAPASSTTYPALPVAGPVELPVHDYAQRAAWDGGRTLEGREVVLTGFVTPAPDGGWSVTRAVMTCCAADARTYPVHVLGDPRPRTPDSWVRVVGRWTPAPDRTAALQAEVVTPVAEPAQPYEE